MIERLQELLAVPIRQNDRCFFRETNLVLRDHARFADAQLVLAHLLDDDCRIGERFGQADAALCVRRPRFQTNLCPFLFSAIESIIHERGIVGKWEFPTSRMLLGLARNRSGGVQGFRGDCLRVDLFSVTEGDDQRIYWCQF